MKPHLYREIALSQKALEFFRDFIKRLVGKRVKIVHFGWWYINGTKFGLSMYWEEEE